MARLPPFHAFRLDTDLPTLEFGPVDCCHGCQVRIARAPMRVLVRKLSLAAVIHLLLQDFPRLDPPDFLGMGPPDFLGMDPPNFLGMGPPAGAAFLARRRVFLRAAVASGAERRCQEAMHFRG